MSIPLGISLLKTEFVQGNLWGTTDYTIPWHSTDQTLKCTQIILGILMKYTFGFSRTERRHELLYFSYAPQWCWCRTCWSPDHTSSCKALEAACCRALIRRWGRRSGVDLPSLRIFGNVWGAFDCYTTGMLLSYSGRDQGASYKAQESPHTKHYLAPHVHSAEI